MNRITSLHASGAITFDHRAKPRGHARFIALVAVGVLGALARIGQTAPRERAPAVGYSAAYGDAGNSRSAISPLL